MSATDSNPFVFVLPKHKSGPDSVLNSLHSRFGKVDFNSDCQLSERYSIFFLGLVFNFVESDSNTVKNPNLKL